MWKETEIGNIPSDWEVGIFNDDLKVQGRIGWKGYKTSDLVYTGPYVVGGAEIKSKIFLELKNAQCLSREKYDESPEIMLKDGDVLLATRGNLGEVGYYHSMYGEGTINPSVIILNNFKGDSKFLFYYLTSKQGNGNVMSLASGSSVPAIYQADVKKLKYPKPPYEEQKKISEVAFSIDLKIDLLHRQNKTLEQLSETLFRQWFVEEAEESWEVVKVSDVVKINSKTISKNYPFAEIEYLDTGSITGGIISEFQAYKLADAPSRAQRIVEDYDIVYSLVRPIQRHYGLLHDLKPNTIVSTGFCVITCNDFSPHFIYLLLTKNENVEYFDSVAEGSTSTYPSLKPSDIADFEFRKPPKEKLDQFSKITLDSWEKIKSNTNQIKTLTQLRDTLLPKLMSGEVRVKN